MNLTYLLILAFSLAGLTSIDWKFSLVFFKDARRATIVMMVGVLFFLLWDVSGIALRIFFVGNSALISGVMIANQLPIEEPIFLALLCYSTLIFFNALQRRNKK